MTKQSTARNKKKTRIKDLPGSEKRLTAKELKQVKGGSVGPCYKPRFGVVGPCDKKYK